VPTSIVPDLGPGVGFSNPDAFKALNTMSMTWRPAALPRPW